MKGVECVKMNKRTKEAHIRRGGIGLRPRKVLGFLFCLILLAGCAGEAIAGWEEAGKILGRISEPKFPDRDFNITDYGAMDDGQTDCTVAFEKAISAAHKGGGGRVVVPAGVYSTGAIHLASNVNLYVSEGAVIKFSTDPNKYLPVVNTRFEGIECINYSPLIYAYEQENIAITGKGTLDGQASEDKWWQWATSQADADDINALNNQGQSGTPVEERIFGAGKHLRPNMIQPYKCKNILIEGVTIKNSPMWHIHFVLSSNITVKNVKVIGHGPNNDGCNPESCKDVLITGCFFDTGDDCITIKAGRNNDGRRVNVPCENIVVQNCQMKDGHGGVVLGSEMTGGVRNVFIENCKMDSPNLRQALRIKSNSVRGGVIENIYMRNVQIGEVNEAVLNINFYFGEGDAGQYLPIVRNIQIENVTSQKSKYVLFIGGYDRQPSITDIFLKDCSFNNVRSSDVLSGVKKVVLENVNIDYTPAN
ncbi:MAG: glycoside hydrolase family 28 protein [Sedimentisphaerales bacterium]|nr:glycoside hydrolase family 28 protein [Sedimentisphaerales bacterium]